MKALSILKLLLRIWIITVQIPILLVRTTDTEPPPFDGSRFLHQVATGEKHKIER